MKESSCSSCKRRVANVKGTTEFLCPSCEKAKIIRCLNCRQIGARYKCGNCEFEGPN